MNHHPVNSSFNRMPIQIDTIIRLLTVKVGLIVEHLRIFLRIILNNKLRTWGESLLVNNNPNLWGISDHRRRWSRWSHLQPRENLWVCPTSTIRGPSVTFHQELVLPIHSILIENVKIQNHEVDREFWIQ